MRVLFDKSAPHGLIRHLTDHVVFTAEDRGWDQLENGEFLTAAEADAFEVFLTADKNLRYQQNLTGRVIAIVVLGHSPSPLVKQHIPEVVAAVNAATPGSYMEVDIPLRQRTPARKVPHSASPAGTMKSPVSFASVWRAGPSARRRFQGRGFSTVPPRFIRRTRIAHASARNDGVYGKA